VLRGHTDKVYYVALTPDARTAISLGHDKALRVWDLARGVEKQVFPQPLFHLRLLGDGGCAIFQSHDHSIHWRDLTTGKTEALLPCLTDGCYSFAVTPDGKLGAFAVGSSIRVWDLEGRAERRNLQGHADLICSVAI